MKYIPLFLAISLSIAHGKSNSSGPDSPVLYGEIIEVSDDRKTVTILQSGSDKREIKITKKTKLSFVGMGKKSQDLKVGYWGKAKVKKRRGWFSQTHSTGWEVESTWPGENIYG
jgi:hypothetical protein